MIAAIKEEGVKTSFKPFTLEITFESVDEARMLWHRLNASIRGIHGSSGNGCVFPDNESTAEAFFVLDTHMERYKLKNS